MISTSQNDAGAELIDCYMAGWIAGCSDTTAIVYLPRDGRFEFGV